MPEPMRDPADDELDRLERAFLEQAPEAFADARRLALESGQSILESEGEAIYEVFPDGRRVFVKSIGPATPAIPGQKYTIR